MMGWIQLVVATPDVEELRCRGETGLGSCCCSRSALGWASACGAARASGPVLGGDRSRCIKREGCGRGGCVAEHWCPVVPQGWRHVASHLAPVSGRYLSFTEREEIAVLLAGGSGVRAIARRLGRAPSTISRELQRNAAIGRGRVEYRASTAQRHAERRAQRPKPAKLAVNPELRAYVQARLSGTVQRPDGSVAGPDIAWRGRRQGPRKDRRWGQCWSPEQISGRLRVDFPDDESMRVSHEAIYQSLYIQGRGALRRELTACLRTGRALRAPRNRALRGNRSFVTDELLISERPAEVDDRAVPGHWEGDLILGTDRSAIGTLVERSSRFTMLLHLPPIEGHNSPRVKDGPPITGAGAGAVRNAIADTITTLPEQLRRSLTWDQGIEMAQHVRLRLDTGLQIYFWIHEARGSAGRTRTPTGCCASISQEAPTSRATAPRSSGLSRRR